MASNPDHSERIEEAAFERAVARASAQITQSLAAIHRRRLVVQTAAVVAIIVSVAAIALLFSFKSTAESNTRADVKYTCQVIKELSTTMGDFVLTDAQLHDKQNHLNVGRKIIKGFEKIIPHSVLIKAQQQSLALSVATTDHWFKVDVPKLEHISHVACRLK